MAATRISLSFLLSRERAKAEERRRKAARKEINQARRTKFFLGHQFVKEGLTIIGDNVPRYTISIDNVCPYEVNHIFFLNLP